MNYAKITSIYFSPRGTTKKVADTLLAAMDGKVGGIDLLKKPVKKLLSFPSDTVTIVSLPVYAGRIPALTVESLKNLKGNGTPAVAVVVYGNRDYDDALLELRDLLTDQGFCVVAAAAFIGRHSIFPQVARNRPDGGDLKEIQAFGKKCQSLLRSMEFLPSKPIEVKGNSPYRKAGKVPLKPAGNKNTCTLCGACAAICPTGAIDMKNYWKIKKKLCISCGACIRICPKNSRGYRGPIYKITSSKFVKKFSVRKDPDIFLP